jgi:hypothetical protein
VQRAIDPPERQVFVPRGDGSSQTLLSPSQTAPTSAATPIPPQLPTGTPLPSATTAPPTATPTLVPSKVLLSGVKHEYQQFNNCGPATLAMVLSYWGWQGDQRNTRAYLRPNFAQVDDKNVNPWEMVAFIQTQTALKGLARVGGDQELIKRLIAAGFPVLIESGIQPHPRDWMGHYLLLSGYDDERRRFITQDSLVGPDLPLAYDDLTPGWRSFNNAYIVAYPPEREPELLAILGAHADPDKNYQSAAESALAETSNLSGRDLFFAWYNLGSNRLVLKDYPGAAQAFDEAYTIYPTISEADRPWRMLWYQAGPLEAYFHTARYQDVITLGNQALDNAGGPLLEETFYWLGRAREATGDLEKAIYDYRKAVEINPNSTPALQELQRLGAAPF